MKPVLSGMYTDATEVGCSGCVDKVLLDGTGNVASEVWSWIGYCGQISAVCRVGVPEHRLVTSSRD
jgi:hypothetical protein